MQPLASGITSLYRNLFFGIELAIETVTVRPYLSSPFHLIREVLD